MPRHLHSQTVAGPQWLGERIDWIPSIVTRIQIDGGTENSLIRVGPGFKFTSFHKRNPCCFKLCPLVAEYRTLGTPATFSWPGPFSSTHRALAFCLHSTLPCPARRPLSSPFSLRRGPGSRDTEDEARRLADLLRTAVLLSKKLFLGHTRRYLSTDLGLISGSNRRHAC